MKKKIFTGKHGDIFYREVNPHKPIAVLFFHGNSLNGDCFVKQLKDDCLSNYRLISLDLPGHGESLRLLDYNVSKLSDILSDFCNKVDTEDLVLVGHSLGGHLAIQSLNKIRNCRALVIFGTPPLGKKNDLSKAFLSNPVSTLLFKANLSSKEVELLANEIGPLYENDRITSAIYDTDSKFREQLAKSISQEDLKNEIVLLGKQQVPFAIFHGAKDSLVNENYLRNISLSGLWQNRIQLIPETGHSPHLESPEIFNRLLNSFLKSIFSK